MSASRRAIIPPANAQNHGFNTAADFMRAVFCLGMGYSRDPRLVAAAASEISTGSEGGLAVPPDYRARINEAVFGEGPLSLADRQPMLSASSTFVVDDTAPWDTTRGIQPTWEPEAQPIPPSVPSLRTVTLHAHKLSALVYVSEELLKDSAFERILMVDAPRAIRFACELAMIQGSGTGMPMGILNSGALITVAAESGPQTADTIVKENISAIWARGSAGCDTRGVFMSHPDGKPEVAKFPDNMLTFGPDGAPRLMGRPLLFHEAMSPLGEVGDIVLVDWGEYLLGARSPDIQTALSLDVHFDKSLAAFRFRWRLDGSPWWGAPQTSRVGGQTRSPIVALAAR